MPDPKTPEPPREQPTGPVVELRYVGDGRYVNGVPAADLTAAQIDHVVYQRSVGREVPEHVDDDGNPAPDPEHGSIRFTRIDKGLERGEPEFAAARDAVVAELVASGIYEAPKAPKKEAAKPAADSPAVTPAQEN